jgi:hypothetical protein
MSLRRATVAASDTVRWADTTVGGGPNTCCCQVSAATASDGATSSPGDRAGNQSTSASSRSREVAGPVGVIDHHRNPARTSSPGEDSSWTTLWVGSVPPALQLDSFIVGGRCVFKKAATSSIRVGTVQSACRSAMFGVATKPNGAVSGPDRGDGTGRDPAGRIAEARSLSAKGSAAEGGTAVVIGNAPDSGDGVVVDGDDGKTSASTPNTAMSTPSTRKPATCRLTHYMMASRRDVLGIGTRPQPCARWCFSFWGRSTAVCAVRRPQNDDMPGSAGSLVRYRG